MLTTYFKSPRLLERYQSELASPYLDDFTTWLESRGYGRSCIRRHVREVVHFAIWAKTKGLAIHTLNRDVLTQLRDHLADHQSQQTDYYKGATLSHKINHPSKTTHR